MELREFIATTLSGIIDGVAEAQARAREKGCHVNPGGLMRSVKAVSENATWDNTTNNYTQMVSFDVALTVEEGKKTDARVGVVAGVFKLGAGGASESKELAVSRVQFSVPVLFPVSALDSKARQTRRG